MSEYSPFADELEEDASEGSENKSFTELRKAYNRLEKQLKSMTPELDELRTFKEERIRMERNTAIEATFKEAGLNAQHAKLFAAMNPDADPSTEAVVEFAKSYGLVADDFSASSEKGFEEANASDVEKGISPISTGSASSALGVEFDEWLKIASSNPDEAARLKKAGRVIYPVAPWRTDVV